MSKIKMFFSIQIFLLFMISNTFSTTISAQWGPPDTANAWQKFSIHLTAEAFDVSEDEFLNVMQDVQSIRIRTETSGYADIGSIDDVQVGSRFSSNFNTGLDGWGIDGDGTLKWHETEGLENSGHIAVHDWAQGQWTYAVTPVDWNGDWSELVGSTFEFYYKSTHPESAAELEISSDFEKRIQLSASPLITPQNTSSTVTVSLNETPATDVEISLSSQNSCFEVPRGITIPAGSTSAQFLATVPSDASTGCTSAIEASAGDYISARLILEVGERAGGEEGDPAQLCGQVTDATSGSGIEGATVSIGGNSTITDFEGKYCLEGISTDLLTANFTGNPRSGETPLTVQFNDLSGTGSPMLTATASNYSTFRTSVSLSPGEEKTLDISLSPVITDADMRIVLNWGENPSDMDLHLLAPSEGDNSSYHVYYSNKGDSLSYPYTYLDHDDRDSYGPETITIKHFISGMYTFYVHQYSSMGSVPTSESVIQIYNRSGLVNTVNVPTVGEGNYWLVGQINGATGQVLINNIIQATAPGLSKRAAQLGKTLAVKEALNNEDVVSHEWDFDNDGTVDSREENPQWTYTAPGDYTVKLTVSDGSSSYSETKTNYISVTGEPPASDDGDYNVTITSIDASNFPAIKIFVSVIDTLTGLPLTELPPEAIEILENGYTVSDIQANKLTTTSGAKADIVFVFDITGSMGDEMAALKNRCISFADSIAARGIDYRLGLVTFDDEVTSIHDFSSDAHEFKTWVEGLYASGGGDTKENALEGLKAATTLSYRDVTQKIVILITDEDYHEYGETGDGQTDQTTESIIDLMNSHDIICNVVGPDLAQHKKIANETGGWFYHIYEDFNDIIDRIGSQIMNQFVITFVPQDVTPTNDTRTIDITINHNGKTGSVHKDYRVNSTQLTTFPQTILGMLNQEYTIDVYVQNVVKLNFAKYVLMYDKNKLAVTSVSSGDFLSQGEASEGFFYDLYEDLGKVEISQSRFVQGADTSTSVSGSGKLAQVTFKIIDANCTSYISFSEIVLREPDGAAITPTTSGTEIYAATNIDGTSSMLCDFDGDFDIDTRDFALLGTYWKPANTAKGDVGPASGAVPILTPVPDSKVNFEDLFTFTRMWNWYYLSLAESGSGLAKSGGHLSCKIRDAENIHLDVTLQDVNQLSMGHVQLHFDPNALHIQRVQAGNLLSSDDATYAFFAEELYSGCIDVAFAKMVHINTLEAIKPNGVLFSVSFEKTGNSENSVVRFGEIDLRTNQNESIYITATDNAQMTLDVVPHSFEVLNYPNPFNPQTTVEFSLPDKGFVQAAVYDIRGRMITELASKEYKAGVHKITWNALQEQTASGVYFCRVKFGNETKSIKMLLVR